MPVRAFAPLTPRPDVLPSPEDEPRPTLVGHGDYVFGVFLVAVAVPDEDSVYYQEIDLVLTRSCILTVRKTPDGREPFDPVDVHETLRASPHEDKIGMITYYLVDAVAEHYLDLTDRLNDAIDDLEDHVEDWPAAHRLEGHFNGAPAGVDDERPDSVETAGPGVQDEEAGDLAGTAEAQRAA